MQNINFRDEFSIKLKHKMAVKIRLQRHGRKNKPFYHIVVADSRAPRDGKFIEKLGTYNPVANPFIINLDLEKSIYWLEKGAQPTHTARSILSKEGVFLKRHLLGGVKKEAFDKKEAELRFENWKKEKEEKKSILAKKPSQAKKEIPKKDLKTEAPKVETSKVEAPKVEIPKTEIKEEVSKKNPKSEDLAKEEQNS